LLIEMRSGLTPAGIDAETFVRDDVKWFTNWVWMTRRDPGGVSADMVHGDLSRLFASLHASQPIASRGVALTPAGNVLVTVDGVHADARYVAAMVHHHHGMLPTHVNEAACMISWFHGDELVAAVMGVRGALLDTTFREFIDGWVSS
jgi:hypothetical protein